jgi:hypothetical protein
LTKARQARFLPGRMLDRLRDVLYRAIVTPRGDAIAAVRIPKDLARRLNATFGEPLATREELAKRARARAKLKDLRAGRTTPETVPRVRPPVLIYFENGRNVRELTRIEELLAAKSIPWKRLDVGGDDATVEFVTRRAQCERDDLPVVFVADQAIGTFDALVRSDVSGELAKLVGTA